MSHRRSSVLRLPPGAARWSLLCSLLLFGVLQVSSLQARTLGFDEALRSALAGNPQLAAAGRTLGIAEGERRQAGLLANPTLSWESEDTRPDSATTTLSLTQPIELGGKRRARVAVAEHGLAIAEAELDVRRNALRVDLLEAFQAALRAQERLRLGEQSVALAQRAWRAARAKVRAGKAPPLEASRAEVQLSEVRLESLRAAVEQAAAYRALAALMGRGEPDFDEVGALAGALAIPPASALLQRLGDSNAMRLARLRIEQSESAVDLARAQRVPDLGLTLGSQYDREVRERVNVVGLSMPLPLFDRNQGRLLAETRRADQARDLRAASELQLRQETWQALDLWRLAEAEVESLSGSQLPTALEAVERATRGFERGKFGFLEVLDAQRTLLAARERYLQALARQSDARARLERIYGDLTALR